MAFQRDCISMLALDVDCALEVARPISEILVIDSTGNTTGTVVFASFFGCFVRSHFSHDTRRKFVLPTTSGVLVAHHRPDTFGVVFDLEIGKLAEARRIQRMTLK